MMNPAIVMKLMSAKNKFASNHPKFVAFFNTILSTGMPEGTIIEISVTKPGEPTITSNMKVNSDDLEMVEMLKDMAKNGNV